MDREAVIRRFRTRLQLNAEVLIVRALHRGPAGLEAGNPYSSTPFCLSAA